MPKPPRRGDIVEVQWIDSVSISLGWAAPTRYRTAAAAPQAYRTSGYWIDGPKGHVLVALSIDLANENVVQVMSIPRVAVTCIQVLGRASRRARRALR